jgi:membrane protein
MKRSVMTWRRFLACFKRAVFGAYDHGALGYAKGAAYSALLAFFPVLTTTTTLLIQANASAVSRKIVSFLFQVAPPGVEDLVRNTIVHRGAQPATLPILAAILAIWAASGVMMSLMEAFQSAYQRPTKRGIVHKRLIAMWLVLAAILPVVSATSLLIFGTRVRTWTLRTLGFLEAGETLRGGLDFLSQILTIVVALLTIMVVTALLYYFGPDAGRSRHVWPGAILASFLWFLNTLGFAWYVRNIGNYNVLYGSIGAAIALLVWMYVLAFTAMIGCEFNVAMEERRGRR